jgi:hypothetical protein
MVQGMKKIFLLLLLLFSTQFLFAATPVVSVSGPDKQLSVAVYVDKGKIYYSVHYKGKEVLEKSPLGVLTTIGDFSNNMKLLAHKTAVIDETYTLNRIKKSQVHYQANELIYTFENAQKQTIDIRFHVSANDVAFQYALPEYGETACCVIEKEATGFNFPANTTTFLTPQVTPMDFWKRTKPSYEEKYIADEAIGTPSQYGLGYTFPGLFHIENNWVLISETGVNSSYCASRLSEGTKDGIYTIAFPDARENNGVGSATPAIALPGATPWRTITVGDNLKPIVETTAPFDVVKPLYESSTDYKFGRSTWSWIMWQDESMNFDDQVKYIDLAALMGYEYILIDALWDTQIGYERMPELIRYARSKGVDVFLWYNSNGYWNDAPQSPKHKMNTSIARKREMQWLKSVGVKGLKVDFFGGDKQQTIQLYEDILSDANEYGLMIIFHGATIPRGWERMYPNYVGSEAVLASENLIFTQEACDNEAYNACLHPFIRNAIGSMEFGPVLLNKRYNRTNGGGSIRRTSDIFQIATAVLFQNPVQMFAIAPNNLTDAPWLAIDFMSEVPTTWDETVFIDGYPGKYCVLARRHEEKWYIAGVNAQKEVRRIKVRLPMLEEQPFVIYYDDENRQAHAEAMSLEKGEEITLEIQPEGGIVLATPRTALWQPRSSDFLHQAKGEDFSSEDVITYRVPDEYPQEGTSPFTIAVNGKYTGVYTDYNAWKNLICFSYFDFAPSKEVEVVLTVAIPFTNYKILPESNSIVSTRDGQAIRFQLKESDKNLSVVFDDNYMGNVLHLFANTIDREAPVKSTDNLIYFGKGYHDLEKMYGGPLTISGNKKIYIVGGAVVNGTIRIEKGDGNTISGHGVLMRTVPGGLILTIAHSKNVNLDGIIACSHRNPGWTVGLHESSNVKVKNAKVVSPHYASTDGFDIVNSNHIYFSDVFVRACDDAITIKGLAKGNPADCPPNENMYFERLQIWNDCNNAMCVGEESRAKRYDNIHFKDIDVIFSYDDRYHHTELDERSVMSIVCLEGTYFSNIIWENIRVNRCERLICMTFKDNFWFGSIQGNQSTEGGVDGVTFKNISVSSNSGSRIANEILLNGWHKDGTPEKTINNITFDRVSIEGIPILNEKDIHIKTNNTHDRTLVKKITFK